MMTAEEETRDGVRGQAGLNRTVVVGQERGERIEKGGSDAAAAVIRVDLQGQAPAGRRERGFTDRPDADERVGQCCDTRTGRVGWIGRRLPVYVVDGAGGRIGGVDQIEEGRYVWSVFISPGTRQPRRLGHAQPWRRRRGSTMGSTARARRVNARAVKTINTPGGTTHHQ